MYKSCGKSRRFGNTNFMYLMIKSIGSGEKQRENAVETIPGQCSKVDLDSLISRTAASNTESQLYNYRIIANIVQQKACVITGGQGQCSKVDLDSLISRTAASNTESQLYNYRIIANIVQQKACVITGGQGQCSKVDIDSSISRTAATQSSSCTTIE
ncbi:hypothetical protein J6590_009830 [Homalodisca vitripennis]|nr:hypothetical protein J6590_009830 [Homalodisca vitripennis]